MRVSKKTVSSTQVVTKKASPKVIAKSSPTKLTISPKIQTAEGWRRDRMKNG